MTQQQPRLSTIQERSALSAKEHRRIIEAEERARTMINGANFWANVQRIKAALELKAEAKKQNALVDALIERGISAAEMLAHDQRLRTGRPKKQVIDWQKEYKKRKSS